MTTALTSKIAELSRWDGKGFTSLVFRGEEPVKKQIAMLLDRETGSVTENGLIIIREATYHCFTVNGGWQFLLYGKKKHCARILEDICKHLRIEYIWK